MAVTPADRNGQEAINEMNNGAEGFEVSSGQNGAAQVQNINNDEGNEKESRTSMLARHQREIRELQNKELSLKKAAAKGSKAEQKAKKKQAEEEIANLDAKMRARQAKELASLGYKSEDGRDSNGRDSLVKAIAGISVTSTSQSSKPSKGVQRRAKRAQQEAEREQRIQEEQDNTISNRVLENQQLQQKLQPLGLSLNEIKADGHCLYRAIENQLSLHPGLSCKFSYQQLREMAAAYMRSHAEDFLPFFLSESENDTKSDESLQESRNLRSGNHIFFMSSHGGRAIHIEIMRFIFVFTSFSNSSTDSTASSDEMTDSDPSSWGFSPPLIPHGGPLFHMKSIKDSLHSGK